VQVGSYLGEDDIVRLTELTREALARFHAISVRKPSHCAIKSNEFGFVLAKPQFAIALS
jgi:hypothetical protein